MLVRGVGAVSLTWPHFGATVALTAGSGPTPAHSAGPDLHRSVSLNDLHRSFSLFYDLCAWRWLTTVVVSFFL
jgi:hypothetical protein